MNNAGWAAILTFAAMLGPAARAQGHASPAYAERFVPVAPNVRLQVLDWGGTGKPVVLLAGLGFDAHEFDTFAPKLAGSYRVFAISRRGFGASSAPAPEGNNYAADQLGDDILAAIAALGIERPILVGHSIAGEELSSIGIRHPERIAGLVYLDAGYAYAWYGRGAPAAGWPFDGFALRADLGVMTSPNASREEQKEALARIETMELPRVESEAKDLGAQFDAGQPILPPMTSDQDRISAAVLRGSEVYTGVHCPVLAIFADPHAPPPAFKSDPGKAAQWTADDRKRTDAFAEAFEKGNDHARVVRIAGASHFVFRSNEAEVLREIDAFAETLR